MLLQLASSANRVREFEHLAFLSNFATHSYRTMQRIGRQGEGYDRLYGEFSNAVEESRTIVRELATSAPESERNEIETSYLQITPDSFENFLALLSDLTWYKNWTIDHPQE